MEVGVLSALIILQPSTMSGGVIWPLTRREMDEGHVNRMVILSRQFNWQKIPRVGCQMYHYV